MATAPPVGAALAAIWAKVDAGAVAAAGGEWAAVRACGSGVGRTCVCNCRA